MRRRARTLLLLVAIGAVGVAVLDTLHVPTFVRMRVIPNIRRIYIDVFPRDASAADVTRSIRDGLGRRESTLPWLTASRETFWNGYDAWLVDPRSAKRGLAVPGEQASTAARLVHDCPAETAAIEERARLYRSGRLLTFEEDTFQLGVGAHWDSAPSKHDDVIYIWEWSTLQHFVNLAEAYRLTGDTSFARTIVDQLRQWHRANPADNSVNWNDPMEVALRLTSLLWTRAIAGDAAAIRGDDPEWTEVEYTHAQFIADHIARFRTHRNHDLFMAIGLYLAAVAHPEWNETSTWHALAEDRIRTELRLQYTAAGVQKEYSPFYQKALLDALLQYAAAKQRLGEALPVELSASLGRQAAFLATVTGPDGRIALFGDSDDHHFVRLDLSTFDDALPTLRLASRILGIDTGHGANCHDDWGADWTLSGSKATQLPPSPTTSSQIYRSEGFFRAQTGSLTLIGTFATLGAAPQYQGHSHADAGTFELWAHDRSVVVDAGTYTYRAALESNGVKWRQFLRGSLAHNVTVVDGASQAQPTEDFDFVSWPSSKLLFASAPRDSIAVILGRQDGYASWLGSGYRLFALYEGSLLVVDWYPGARGSHTYDTRLLIGDTAVARAPAGFELTDHLRLVWGAMTGDTSQVIVGAPGGGWRSINYGTIHRTAQISRVFRTNGPAATAFMLGTGPIAVPSLTPLRSDDSTDGLVVTTPAWPGTRLILRRLSSGGATVESQREQ